MPSINRGMALCALALLLAAGCESVALMPRPDIDDRAGNGGTAQPDRYARGEVVGMVERVDDIRREIHLRTDDRRSMVLKYAPSAWVLDRNRQFSVGDVRSGDFVRAEPSRGEYVDVIYILEASRS